MKLETNLNMYVVDNRRIRANTDNKSTIIHFKYTENSPEHISMV